MYQTTEADRLQSTIDWLTLTCAGTQKRMELQQFIGDQFSFARSQGETPMPWRFLNYAGVQIQGMRWGTRQADDVLMLSGDSAHDMWRNVVILADNISRVDLAVTVFLVAPVRDVAVGCYRDAERGRSESTHPHRHYSYIENNQGGQTLYVGSRSSDQFGRLYDKGVRMEIPDRPGSAWRYEVEYKRDPAAKIARSLQAVRTGDDMTTQIKATVYWWFLEREVMPIFNRSTEDVPMRVITTAKITEDDRTLEWLSSQVSPSVRRLLSNGKGDQVMRALGLVQNTLTYLPV